MIGKRLGIGVKGFFFAIESHDPAMRMGAAYRDVEQFTCEDVGGTFASSDVGRAACREGTIDPLCPSQAKFEDRIALCSDADACRFCGDEGGEVDEVKEGAFEKLALDEGACDPYERFMWEYDISFGDRVDGAGELHLER